MKAEELKVGSEAHVDGRVGTVSTIDRESVPGQTLISMNVAGAEVNHALDNNREVL
jgi:hypothetical protein